LDGSTVITAKGGKQGRVPREKSKFRDLLPPFATQARGLALSHDRIGGPIWSSQRRWGGHPRIALPEHIRADNNSSLDRATPGLPPGLAGSNASLSFEQRLPCIKNF
jgi:hypothetical protein